MIAVYAAAGAVALIAVAGIVLGARRAMASRAAAAAVSAAIFADRRDELAAEARGQGLSDDDAAALEAELTANLADEIKAAPSADARPAGAGLPAARVGAAGLVAAGLCFAMYAWWGEPAAPLLAEAETLLRGGAAQPDRLAALKGSLARRAARHPQDGNALFYLGLAHMQGDDYGSAEAAFAALHGRLGATAAPALDAAWAQASYMAAGGRVTPAVQRIAERVLAAEPDHLPTLELLSADALRRGALAEAADYLGRATASAPPDRRQMFLEALELARKRGVAATDEPAQTLAIAVDVSLAPEFEVPAATPVFVIARAGAAAGPPLAVARLVAGDLPARVTLTDANAMLPGRSLAQQASVEVVARISLSGGAVAKAGDLESEPAVVRPGAAPVAARIDRRVP